jgi:uncharacterized protein with beta-barrel porin domain
MRINKVQLAGLAVALAGVAAGPAKAEDVTISTATTTPLSTSDPVAAAPVAAGDITVASGGTITVTAGQTAITVDSSNDVTIASGGRLVAADQDSVTGILIEGGNSGLIKNEGQINLTEAYVGDDTDDDGDLDGPFAESVNLHGMRLQAGPSFIGDISSSGTISVEGNQSYGIRLDTLLDSDATFDGSLTNTGALNIVGDDSYGVAILGDATGGTAGDVHIGGTVNVRGENSTGLLVDGQIDGALTINGSWNVTGYRNAVRPLEDDDFDADDMLQGGSAIHIRHNVVGGVTVQGVGFENDLDDDGDGLEGEADDNATASITLNGEAPALFVEAEAGETLVLGVNGDGYGLQVRGAIATNGVFDGITGTGISLQGDSAAAIVTVNGGIALDSTLGATAWNANATALHIGDWVNSPLVLLRGNTVTNVQTENVFTAYGVRFDGEADVPVVDNRGTIRARLFGETGHAVVFHDAGSSVQTLYNSGSIIAEHVPTDDDLTDDVPPPDVTGDEVAIDFSASTNNLLIWQRDLPDETDDDSEDDLDDPAILIQGDILLGAGSDTLQLDAGSIIGDIAFGAGADVFNIDNGAVFRGRIDNTFGLDINVTDGALYHGGGDTNISSALFDADSILGIVLSPTAGETTHLIATGQVTFVDGSVIAPVLPIGLPDSSDPGDYIFLTAAGGLVGEEFVVGAVTAEGAPYLYNLSIGVVSGDPNSLEANYDMKTATELGLTSNQTAAFDPLVEALRLDDAAAAAFASLSTQADFFDAYDDLMPSYSGAAAEIATTAIQQMQGATSNRLAATRLQGLDEVSIWAQEIGYLVTRTPPTANGQEFDGAGFGIAVGIDGPLESGDLFGLSASFVTSEVEEAGRPEGEIASWFGQFNAYLGAARGPIDLDFIAGLGAGKTQSRRFVEIGEDFSAMAQGDWWAFEGHASARASAPMRMADWFIVTPQAGLTYVALSEQAYTEEGGGLAIDYDVDSAFSQRLWADAGVEFSGRFNWGARNVFAPRLFVGYRANVLDEEAERTVRFVSGGDDFTLIDEGLGDGGPIVGIGFDASNGYSTFSLGYEGEFGDQIERHSLNAAIRFRF